MSAARGLVFGTAAESYERFRLGYPDEVVDRTLNHAGPGVDTAVEVGAGTGKATRAFASRGIHVTALEPDPDMLFVLERETAGMPVEPVLSTLEDYVGPPTRLVYAGASWHWVDVARRLPAAASLLHPGGTLAIFGAPLQVADPDLQAALAAIAGGAGESIALRPPDTHWASDPNPIDEQLRGSELFEDVELHYLPRQLLLPKQDFVGYLSTLSSYLVRPWPEAQDLLRRIVEVVPEQVPVDLMVGLHLARRR